MRLPTIPVVALAVVALDQITKVAVVFGLDLANRVEIDVVPPFLVFRMAWNYGINFGLFAHGADAASWVLNATFGLTVDGAEVMRWVLIAVAAVISALVWLWVRREESGWKAEVAAGLLIGGAAGNVIDRLAYGAVADFLNMSCCGIDNPFAFNVADVAIFFGAIGLVLFTDFAGGKTPSQRKPRRKSP